jgi:TRAP-type uncharacterized transport system fused permease subunit
LKIFEDAAQMMVSVAIPSAAGIIIGSVFYSGLAVRFSNTVIDLAQSSTLIALILAMFICLLLGMGLTVIAVYILMASLVIPALVSLGVDPLAAHFFAFHYGVHSYITPPVALSAFAAAAIEGWLAGPLSPVLRLCMGTATVAIITHILPFQLTGLSFATLVYIWRRLRQNHAPREESV